MKLVVLVVASCCCVLADKNLARPHRVVRVGRNGRQVVSELSHGLNAGLSPTGDRRVVLKRKGRVFPRVVPAPLAHHAAVPLAAPLTFANHRVHHGHGHHTVQLHHAPVPATPIRLAPLSLAPVPASTTRLAPLSLAPVPASTTRLAPLPLTSHAVHHAPLPLTSHTLHHAPLPLASHTLHHAPLPAPLPLASHTLHHAPIPASPIRLAPLPLSVVPPPAPVPLAVATLPPPPPVPGIRQPAVVAPTLEYGAPATVAPEVRAPLELYAAAPVPEVVPVVEAPAPVVPVAPVAPVAPVVEVSREVDLAYSAPSAPKEVVVTAVKAVPAYTAPRTAASEAVAVRADPIAILRSVYNPPAHTAVFDYSYETANGIKQEAVGSLRTVDDTEVSVMKGSYSYVGAAGQLYQVDWYADETGFHPSAPHFPKSVVPNHPEVAAAVRAQIEFAAQEDAAAAAASARAPAYAAPPPLAYGAPEEPLPAYSSS